MATREIAIALFSAPGRAQEGDIITIRNPLGYVGRKEQNLFLWFLVDDTGLPSDEELLSQGSLGEKRKYKIDLTTLKSLDASLDLTRLRDPLDRYQPFLQPDSRDGTFSRVHTPLTGTSIVTNKEL